MSLLLDKLSEIKTKYSGNFALVNLLAEAEALANAPHGYEECSDLREMYAKLRAAIVTHRSQKADDRCIEDDDRLYEVLGDGIKCDRRVGCKFEMAKNCLRFIEQRTEEGGWPTYVELEAKIAELQTKLQEAANNKTDEAAVIAMLNETTGSDYETLEVAAAAACRRIEQLQRRQ